MQRYYAQRAAQYERVYHKPERQADLHAMQAWLAGPEGPFAGRRVLEIACGTGWWTPHAARHAREWLASDVNPQTLDIARTKPLPACVRLARLDAYTLAGLVDEPFDAAFAGCWWSHVPLARLPEWLARLHARLERGARVVFIDNAYVPGSSTPIARRDAEGNTYQLRRLDDGSTYEVLKNFPTRDEALALLGPRARRPQWRAWTHYWALEYELGREPVKM
ncbi:MAG: class I SAM-dependent methyltransferase [Comamonadaceae bacterium]|nr:class I SAM-dependent methyltransferase [Rubrivivax sp.]NLZ40334.1 class I SAM-dependent methyltransferase [Comamonadaceae bacterium]